jgi:phenylalanyl-tRNA synthetase beta chain
LLAARHHNETHGNAHAELFEIANVYLPREGCELPDEPTHLGLVTGRDFLGLKGIVEALLARLNLDGRLEARPLSAPGYAAGRAAVLLLDDNPLGEMGELSRERLRAQELDRECSAAELDFGRLVESARLVARHAALPPFPAVARDLSLVVDRALPWGELSRTVARAGGSLLESVEFLDTFAGGSVPSGMHSVHFGLRFRHPERTLTGDEVERAVRAVVDACSRRFQAPLRS